MFSLKILEENLSLVLPSYWWPLAVLSIPRLLAASLRMAKLVDLRLTPKLAIAITKSPVMPTPVNLSFFTCDRDAALGVCEGQTRSCVFRLYLHTCPIPERICGTSGIM